jgi:hypothetical protein
MSSVFVSHTGYFLAVLTADLTGCQRNRHLQLCLTAQLPNIGPWPPVLHVVRRDILVGRLSTLRPTPSL